MSNVKDIKVRKFPVILNGETRNLVFDLNAFAEIEEAYGDIEEAMKAMEKGSIKALRLLLWSGMLHESEDITIKEVGRMIDMAGIQDLNGVIVEGLGAHMPTAEQMQQLAPPQKLEDNAQVEGEGPNEPRQ